MELTLQQIPALATRFDKLAFDPNLRDELDANVDATMTRVAKWEGIKGGVGQTRPSFLSSTPSVTTERRANGEQNEVV